MDEEIKNLINEYVKQIESKEADFVLLKREIDEIIFHAQNEMEIVLTDLDSKFDENKITEEEYLKLMGEQKSTILQNTKKRLDDVVTSIEGISIEREKVAQANADKINDLKKELGLLD